MLTWWLPGCNKKDPQKKHPLGTVSKNPLEGLNMLNSTNLTLKETKYATMNIFHKKSIFNSFVKVELSYVFTINLFTIAENCTEK